MNQNFVVTLKILLAGISSELCTYNASNLFSAAVAPKTTKLTLGQVYFSMYFHLFDRVRLRILIRN